MITNAMVMHENYANPDSYMTFTYSSQVSQMPASNVLDRTMRTRVWRSAGYWVITSANKGIVLQTAAGVNQTVNIAEGTYTTDAAFLTAIDTALTSESSAAAFTVTRDVTTNKIKITSDGAGGTLLRLMCTNVAFTAATILGFSTASDLTGALTYTADTLKIHMYEWLKIDMGMSVNPKAVILRGLRNNAFGISATAVVKVQGNGTDVWTAPEYEATLTWNRKGMEVLSESGIHTEALRYWRIYIEDPSNVNGYVELSLLYIGDAIVFDGGRIQYPVEWKHVTLSDAMKARSGVSYVDKVQVTREVDLNWKGLETEEREELESFIEDVDIAHPFFVALDPNGVYTSSSVLETVYCKFPDLPKVTLNRRGERKFDSDWTLREEL